MILVVYVDDIILTVTDLVEIDALKSFLHDRFRIKDLGILHYFLGVEVMYSSEGVLLHQKKFIADLLTDFNCSDCSFVISPFELHGKLQACVGDPLPNPELYYCLIRKLIFLTHTCPDLSFVVQLLSQFMQAPCMPHWRTALHLLRYLKGYI